MHSSSLPHYEGHLSVGVPRLPQLLVPFDLLLSVPPWTDPAIEGVFVRNRETLGSATTEGVEVAEVRLDPHDMNAWSREIRDRIRWLRLFLYGDTERRHS
jgi:hypothetical protein